MREYDLGEDTDNNQNISVENWRGLKKRTVLEIVIKTLCIMHVIC